MRFFDYLRLSIKNLSRQRARTILTVTAIMVGSFSLILMMSIIISIRQSFVKQFQELGAFDLVTVVKDPNSVDDSRLISSNGDPFEGKKMDDSTLKAIRALPHVAQATPTVTVNAGMMRMEGVDKKTWPNVIAFDPSNDVFNISIIAGRKLTDTDMDKIVIGSNFINNVDYKGNTKDLIGKNVILYMKTGPNNAPDWGPLPEKPPENADENWYKSKQNTVNEIKAEIVGISASSNVDGGGSYISMAWAKKLMTNVSWQYPKEQPKDQCDQNNKYEPCVYTPPQMEIVKTDNYTEQGFSSIIIKVDSQDNLSKVEEEVQKLGYGANTAQKILEKINQILTMIGVVLALIGGISLFVAAIGIINTMIMAAYERTREIGIMRACGATRSTIRRLFTFEAAILGFLGGLFGLALSYALVSLLRLLVQNEILMLGDLPISEIGNFPWWLIVSVLSFTTLIGILAGLYPARRAAKMNPIDALRYE